VTDADGDNHSDRNSGAAQEPRRFFSRRAFWHSAGFLLALAIAWLVFRAVKCWPPLCACSGPCSEAIIAAGVQRVVAAIEDPNPVTTGSGFERLRAAGIEVFTGVREVEARRLNEAFACWIRTRKPFVTLKSALTLDGQLALPNERKKAGKGKGREWISSEESRAEVHRMRHASDALLTGVGTILADDPLLTDRSGLPRRRKLLRVVLDSKLRLSPKSRIVKTADEDLLVFTAASLHSSKARKLQSAGVEIVRAISKDGRIDLRAVLARQFRLDIGNVITGFCGKKSNGRITKSCHITGITGQSSARGT
jgi:diaminohydroxyphosphoribosylaminopyrimidine deaminase/5-amino-6-(5-phosphoribosylamino)uracil reductase